RQGEEVEVLLGVLAGRGGRQQHGLVVEVGGDGSAGLLGQAPGLEPDGTGAETAVVDGGFGGMDLRTLHRVLLFSLRPGASSLCPGVRSSVFSCVRDRGTRIRERAAPVGGNRSSRSPYRRRPSRLISER